MTGGRVERGGVVADGRAVKTDALLDELVAAAFEYAPKDDLDAGAWLENLAAVAGVRLDGAATMVSEAASRVRTMDDEPRGMLYGAAESVAQVGRSLRCLPTVMRRYGLVIAHVKGEHQQEQ